MPPRIAPSPAAEEPGQQNAAARIRSSREAQSRLLAERRGDAIKDSDEPEGHDLLPSIGRVDRAGIAGKREGEAERPRLVPPLVGGPAPKIAKVKLVVLYRLELDLEPDVAVISGRDSVTMEYVLRAVAREGREKLRGLMGEADVADLTAEASAFRSLTEGIKVVGDPMTVYVQPDALQAMHRASGDPWCALPRATVVGAYFSAIVVRLIKARRAG